MRAWMDMCGCSAAANADPHCNACRGSNGSGCFLPGKICYSEAAPILIFVGSELPIRWNVCGRKPDRHEVPVANNAILAWQLCSKSDRSPMRYDLELELTDDELFELKSALELSRYLAQQYGNDDRRERCQDLQKKLDASERKFRKDGHTDRASG
jgi:hypothetical protein